MFNINNEMSESKINLLLWMCVLFYFSLVCITAYANIHFKTTVNNIEVSEVHCGSAVRFGQALPGYVITTHHLYASLLYLSR